MTAMTAKGCMKCILELLLALRLYNLVLPKLQHHWCVVAVGIIIAVAGVAVVFDVAVAAAGVVAVAVVVVLASVVVPQIADVNRWHRSGFLCTICRVQWCCTKQCYTKW